MNEKFALIIEDDSELAAIFAFILREKGFETEIILDGQTALEKIADKQPDLVMLDMHLPHLSGAAILKEIRAQPQLASIKVLVITADPSSVNGIEELADLTLIKPVSYMQINDLIDRLTQKTSP